MDNNTAQAGSAPEYPREIYEPVLATSMELDEYLRQEFTINYFDLDGDHEVHTCYGDIKKTIDALMDYTNILDTVCVEWSWRVFNGPCTNTTQMCSANLPGNSRLPSAMTMPPPWKNAGKTKGRPSSGRVLHPDSDNLTKI